MLNLQQEVQVWQELAMAAEEEASQIKAQADLVPGLEARVEQLTIALQATAEAAQEEPETHDQPDQWHSIPRLESSSVESAQRLYLALQELTGERIVFTERATSSWKKANYPFPDEIREALVSLAKAATQLYDGLTERSMPQLDDWFRVDHNLKVSLADDTIQQNKNLRFFKYEERRYDRTPHVKVRDNAPHQHVGRIHFALDPENSRIIVDHVGVKLY